MTRELAKKARLRKYVSQAAWEEIEADTGEIVRGGRREDVSVLFSDIQGFTTFTERHQPEEVVDYLNRFFDYMVLAIVEAGGIVDKFIGDCIMGVFLPTPDQKRPPEFRSVLAALRMKRNLADFNLGQAQLGLQEFQTGIGLNGGPVVLGNVGAASRLEFTVLGDTVNLASRLESESREGTSTKIFLSGVLYHRVRELVDARAVGEKQVKGKQQSVEIYEVTGLRNIPFFREQFGSAPVPARIEILQICGLSRVPEGRDFLIEVAGRSTEELAVRGEALRALGGFVLLDDGPARAFLRETVGKNEDEALVGVAVAALALARDDSLGPLFGDLLAHPSHRVRANAVEALLVLLVPDKRDLLKRAARDPHPRVCANALLGLWILEDPDVLYGLLDMLDAPEAPRRSSGAYAVGTLASARSFRLLFEGLPTDGGAEPAVPGKPPVESRFPNAARILARLRKMLQGTDASERRQATRSLALIGDAQCAQELVKLLESENDPNVRYELEQTVQKLRHRSVPGALRRGVG
jgi:class 3 adenylate cyclase